MSVLLDGCVYLDFYVQTAIVTDLEVQSIDRSEKCQH